MNKFLFLAMIVAAIAGCKRKLSRDEVEKELKNAFFRSLTTSRTYNASRDTFQIKGLNFFEDKEAYDCEFTVRLKQSTGFDTTGIMTAKISKDFTDVKRIY